MSAHVVLKDAELARALKRMAHEIVEAHGGVDDLVLLGIPTRGVTLAARLASHLEVIAGASIPTGSLDVTLFRDDLAQKPSLTPGATEIPAEGIDAKTVVLVDDVLFSGRTVRAALDAIQELGRPAAVRLAILVDRGHRELPIRPDYVGKNIPSAREERVNVRLVEVDGFDEVTIER